MNNRTRLVIGAIVCAASWTALNLDLLLALGLGIAVYALLPQPGSAKALFVMDMETGQMHGQPNDAITQEYLRKRESKG